MGHIETIREGCHYYHFLFRSGNGPLLHVIDGSVDYIVQDGPADEDGPRCLPGSLEGGSTINIAVPKTNFQRLCSLIIVGSKPNTRYRINATGYNIEGLNEYQRNNDSRPLPKNDFHIEEKRCSHGNTTVVVRNKTAEHRTFG